MVKGLFGRVQQELEAREKCPGLSMADILLLPDPLRRLANWLVREREVGLSEVATFLEQDEAAARATLATLVEKGFVNELEIRGETRYRVRLAVKRGREVPLDIWQCLGEKVEE